MSAAAQPMRKRSRAAMRAAIGSTTLLLAAEWLQDTGEQECANFLRDVCDSIKGPDADLGLIDLGARRALRDYRISMGRKANQESDGTA